MALNVEQRRIVRLIKREGQNIADPRTRRRYLIAAVETGLVESGLRNLPGGDADSQGWRQERASLYANPRNIRASVRRFREEFEQQYDPGETAGQVAAQVQRPREDLRYKYGTRRGEAVSILGEVGGGGGGGTPGSGPQYRTIAGVDNSGLRQQSLVNYLSKRGQPGALANLGRELSQAQDTETRRIQTRGSRPGSPDDGSGGALPHTNHALNEMLRIATDVDSLNNKGKVPYLWGGGHGSTPAPVGSAVDCSGFVSQILGVAPRVSGDFATSWGKPGKGKWVTVYANSEHVLMSMRDPRTNKVRWFGTSRSNPGGGAGEIDQPSKEYLARFARRHPGKR